MSRSFRFCLYLLIFFSVFNFTVSIMGGGYIARSLGGSSEISIYTVSFFGLGNALVFPFSYELARRFGNIQVLIFSLLCFFCTTFLCTQAPTFFVYVLIRFFSGIFSGTFFPLSLILIQDHTSPDKKNTMFAWIALITTVTPVIGACYGGWLAYDFHWSWPFFSQLPVLFVVGCVLYKNKVPHPKPSYKSFDWTGYIFYILGIGALVSSVALGQELDWFRSPLICFLLAVTALCTLFFILWEWNHEDPFLPLKLFKIPTFSLSILCVLILFSAYFGMIIMLSLWLQIDANYTPLWIALILSHMAIAGGTLFVLLEKWFEHVTTLWVVLLAICFFAISCFYSTNFNAEVNFGRLSLARIFAGLGLSFFLFPLLIVCVKSLPKSSALSGIAIFQSMRLLGGSLGTVGYTTLWIRRRVFYHERLAEQLTTYSQQTQQFISELSFYSPAKNSINPLLEKGLLIQADALALADCFHLMGWIMVGVFAITFFHLIFHIKKKPLKKAN